MRRKRPAFFLLLVFIVEMSLRPDTAVPDEIVLPVHADRVTVIESLPDFASTQKAAEDGLIYLELGDEPVWVIEGDLPRTKRLEPEKSPFGFHPAAVDETNYKFAQDIGVTWDRGGLYLMWVLVQPELEGGYDWRKYDFYFDVLPEGMFALKNITIAIGSMVDVPGRPRLPGKRPRVDVSRHLEGNSFRPKDAAAYRRWVKAAVERYDGDGVNDMPGLRKPLKHWQIDNEPPQMREGYADFVRLTSRAVKEADPAAKILLGGLDLPCGEERKIRNYRRTQAPILKELGGRHIDIVDFHWFGFAGEWKQLADALRIVRKDLEAYGFGNIPIWFTEMGTYSGSPTNIRGAGGFPEQSERTQAVELLKRYAVSLGEGVEKIFWAWGMKEGFGDPRDNDFFDNTGFVYDGLGLDDLGRGTTKIIYWTYRKVTELLNYWDGSPPEKIETEKNVYAYRFRYDKDGPSGIVIAWRDF